jgi:hypothetical protein
LAVAVAADVRSRAPAAGALARALITPGHREPPGVMKNKAGNTRRVLPALRLYPRETAQAAWTLMRRGCSCGRFGMVTSSTPFT